MLSASNLTKVYRTGQVEFAALKGVSLHIQPGEFVGIVGRSGSGKSTLLYQLSLLDQPTSGSVSIADRDTTRLTEAERTDIRLSMFGYVFQQYALLPDLTARENVALPMLMLGRGKAEAYDAAVEALGRVGLADKLHNLPSQLSGGEQQRVAIARAISHAPAVLFADEPTANLDTETARTVMDVFNELKKQGQTIVMVTHEPDYEPLFDRVLRMNDGTLA